MGIVKVDIQGYDEVIKKYNQLLEVKKNIKNLAYKRINRSIKRIMHKDIKSQGYNITFNEFAPTILLYNDKGFLTMKSKSKRMSLSDKRVGFGRGKNPKIKIKIKKQSKSFSDQDSFFIVTINGKKFVATRKYYGKKRELIRNNYTYLTKKSEPGRLDKRFKAKGKYSKSKFRIAMKNLNQPLPSVKASQRKYFTSYKKVLNNGNKLTQSFSSLASDGHNTEGRSIKGREAITILNSISQGNEFRETYINPKDGLGKLSKHFYEAVEKEVDSLIKSR